MEFEPHTYPLLRRRVVVRDADSKIEGEIGGGFLISLLLVEGLGEAAEGVGEGFDIGREVSDNRGTTVGAGLVGLDRLLCPGAPVQVRPWAVVLVVRETIVDVGGVVDGMAQIRVDRVGIVAGLVAACLGIGVEVGVETTGWVEERASKI
jgi:hypothetical protein